MLIHNALFLEQSLDLLVHEIHHILNLLWASSEIINAEGVYSYVLHPQFITVLNHGQREPKTQPCSQPILQVSTS